MADMS